MKLVILDRDGVINEDSANFIKNPDEWIPIPNSLESIALLNQHGFRVAIATNQSGIARGFFDMATLNAIHDKMHRAVAQVGGRIDAVFYCPHYTDDNCDCRKPKDGMVREIGKRFGIDLSNVYGVGDALRDVQAFSTGGCKPILVRTGKGEETLANAEKPEFALPTDTLVVDDLAAAAAHIIAN